MNPLGEGHRTTIRVRYNECDPMGVAHHGSYPTWFEIGRTELLRAHGVRYRDLEADGLFIVVAKLEVTYRRPARYDNELTLFTRIERMTRAKVIHAYQLHAEPDQLGRTLIAEARTTIACVDDDGRVQPLPEGMREMSAG